MADYLPLKAIVMGHSQFDHDGLHVSDGHGVQIHGQQLCQVLRSRLRSLLRHLGVTERDVFLIAQ